MGKTWLVRDLAARTGRELCELNFERDLRLALAFESNDPRRILGEVELLVGRAVDPARSLLFLDEIQAAGEVLSKLRWFYEELPELPVIAAGSLLELTLADHSLSMPVGRVAFGYVEPMSFREFLTAHERTRLLDSIAGWRPGETLSGVAHQEALRLWQRYAMLGGMPAVVASDLAGSTGVECRSQQLDLVAAYRADFAKYAGRIDRRALDAVLLHVARTLGDKIVYARVADGLKSHHAKAALELLSQARVCHLVPHTAANGVPLAAEASARSRKATLLDAGLLHALLGTPAASIFPPVERLAPSLRGRLADQLVGQQLRLVADAAAAGAPVFYWQRGGGRPGEIDYVIQLHGRVLPVEVKAGAAGAMKSLHQFMVDKGLELAVRCDGNPPSALQVDVSTTSGQASRYRLVSVPHYLVWNLAAILEPLG